MSKLLVSALFVACGCYESHLRIAVDASERDAAVLDAGLESDADIDPDASVVAPTCVEPPVFPCLDVEEVGVIGIESDDTVLLHGLVIDSSSGYAMYSAARPTDEGRRTPGVIPFSTRGFALPVSLDSNVHHYAEWGTLDIGRSGLSTWAVWQYAIRPEPTASVDAYETVSTTITDVGVTSPLRLLARTPSSPEGAGDPDLAVLPLSDSSAWVVSADGSGAVVAVTGSDGPIVLSSSASGPVDIGQIPDGVVVLWHEPTRTGFNETHVTVLHDDGSPPRTRILMEGESSQSALLARESEIYVARFERNDTDLRESRLRIFHLDASLDRRELDRTYRGWGGISPTGLALTEFAGEAWIVWQVVDVRIGARDAVYAAPLRGLACGAAVENPVRVLSGEPTLLGLEAFSAVGEDERLWFMRVEGNTATASERTVHLYVASSCH